MNDAQIFAQVMAVIVASVGALTAVAVIARVVLARAAIRRQLMAGAQKGGGRDEGQMQRIEDAVESIAVEVERISEAQRFTARLLAERVPEHLTDRADAKAPAALERTESK